MVPHSSTLAWKIPWMEEPGRLQSMGSLRVRHDRATSLSLFLSCIGEGNGNPLQCSCLENPRDGGAWWAAVYGVAQSWTGLKRLSSSSDAKVGSQETPGITGKFGLWIWNEAGQRLRVLPRQQTGHNKHPLPIIQEKTTHGHHQIVNTEIRLIIFFAAKDGETLYSQQK